MNPGMMSRSGTRVPSVIILRLLLLTCFGVFWSSSGSVDTAGEEPVAPKLTGAYQALMDGYLDAAIGTLQQILKADPNNGEASLLLCRSFYAEEHEDEAIMACETAVQKLPHSSEAWDWMGRAYGFKANLAGPVAGFTLARKVKVAFETAVALDRYNGAAVSDLGEFYIKAPAIIGGGLDKATALAASVKPRLPQEAHRMDAMAAEKRKDYGTAVREFKAAIQVADRANAWDDLGGFYMLLGQYDQAVAALNEALSIDRANGPSVVDAAMLLDSMHREPMIAAHAFRSYLAGDDKSDAAPVVRVDVELGKLLAGEGDKSGAKIEFGKALQLASGYVPARLALQEL